MAFTSTITDKSIFGNLRCHMGSYTQASGDTGGDIDTGLRDVKFCNAVGALTTSDSSGTVTITTADPGAAQTAYWIAIGY